MKMMMLIVVVVRVRGVVDLLGESYSPDVLDKSLSMPIAFGKLTPTRGKRSPNAKNRKAHLRMRADLKQAQP